MRSLHKNQQLLMEFLLNKKEGATLDELAAHLGITNTAAKEHLLKIQSHGYIQYADTKGSVGRPRRRYFLSPEGHDVFPKQYSWLSSVILESLADEMGPDSVSKFMHTLADRVSQSMKDQFEGQTSTAELLAKINQVMNELGYRSTIKQSDVRKGAVLEATNCVYHSVAKQHPELCGFDVRFLENVSGLNVKLESCIARGGESCRFCLKNK